MASPLFAPPRRECTNCGGAGYLATFEIPGGGERHATSNGYECEVCYGQGTVPGDSPNWRWLTAEEASEFAIANSGATFSTCPLCKLMLPTRTGVSWVMGWHDTVGDVERRLREHTEGHTPLEYLTEIVRLQTQVTELVGAVEAG